MSREFYSNSKFLHWHFIVFPCHISIEQKQISFGDFWREMLTCFIHSKVLEFPRRSFNVITPQWKSPYTFYIGLCIETWSVKRGDSLQKIFLVNERILSSTYLYLSFYWKVLVAETWDRKKLKVTARIKRNA